MEQILLAGDSITNSPSIDNRILQTTNSDETIELQVDRSHINDPENFLRSVVVDYNFNKPTITNTDAYFSAISNSLTSVRQFLSDTNIEKTTIENCTTTTTSDSSGVQQQIDDNTTRTNEVGEVATLPLQKSITFLSSSFAILVFTCLFVVPPPDISVLIKIIEAEAVCL